MERKETPEYRREEREEKPNSDKDALKSGALDDRPEKHRFDDWASI